MANRVLVISYIFPPSQGIGGRRWAKIGKYLKRMECDIFVLAARPETGEISPWEIDTADLNVIRFESAYPKILKSVPVTFTDKVLYRIQKYILYLRCRGTIYDRACRDKETILGVAGDIIRKEGIKTLICTGAPFSILYYGTLLKKKFPEIRLLSDLRDPWTWGTNYGYKELHSKRSGFEKEMEQQVINVSDKIMVPAPSMKNHLTNEYPQEAAKVEVIPHAFDKDDFTGIIRLVPKEGIRLIYGGTLYNHTSDMLRRAFSIFRHFKSKAITFSVFGSIPIEHRDLFTEFNDLTNINPWIESKKLMAEIAGSSFYFACYPDSLKDFISTKFYEIIYLRVPILLIAKSGELSEFISNNRLGYHILPENIEKDLVLIISGEVKIDYNYNFDIGLHEFDHLSTRVLELL